MNTSDPIKNIYFEREKLVIIGLTGRTGSGCTTVASILNQKNFNQLSLKDPKTHDFNNADERKYNIVHKYMSHCKRWKPFTIIEVSSVILAITLSFGIDSLLDFFV